MDAVSRNGLSTLSTAVLLSGRLDERPNSAEKVQTRAQEGKVSWSWPLLMIFIRFPLLVIGFLLVLAICIASGQSHAVDVAMAVTRYNLTLVADIVCLFLLGWLSRRESIRLRDLFCFTRKHLIRDLLVNICLFMLMYIVVAGLYIGALFLTFGPTLFQSMALLQALGGTSINPLGLPTHLLISLLILPISSGVTEELVYRGYAQPRLQALTGKKWLAVLLMALGFGVQHIAFALTNWQLALAAFLATFATGIIFGLLYLVVRQRLFSLVFLHWQSDLISLGIAPLLLTMFIGK